VEIPKPDGGGVRKLGILRGATALVQPAVLPVLQKCWDATFSEHRHGFRPGRRARPAGREAPPYIAAGDRGVGDLDGERFFARGNHDRRLAAVAERVADQQRRKWMRAFLEAGGREDGWMNLGEEGTPPGGPLSPLLSNWVRDELDRE